MEFSLDNTGFKNKTLAVDPSDKRIRRCGQLSYKTMPYQISHDNNVVQITLSGRITGADLQAIVNETTKHDRSAEVPHRITDMSAITELSIGFPDVLGIAERRRRLEFANPYKSAIVAPQSEHVGYARMMQTLNDNPQVTIEVFSNKKEAIDWIATASNSK